MKISMPLKLLETNKANNPAQDFNRFGLEDIAYVKLVAIDGQQMHAVHAADGTPLTVLTDREIAFATVRQHEMEPLSVH